MRVCEQTAPIALRHALALQIVRWCLHLPAHSLIQPCLHRKCSEPMCALHRLMCVWARAEERIVRLSVAAFVCVSIVRLPACLHDDDREQHFVCWENVFVCCVLVRRSLEWSTSILRHSGGAWSSTPVCAVACCCILSLCMFSPYLQSLSSRYLAVCPRVIASTERNRGVFVLSGSLECRCTMSCCWFDKSNIAVMEITDSLYKVFKCFCPRIVFKENK